jgi:hypothetical protein
MPDPALRGGLLFIALLGTLGSSAAEPCQKPQASALSSESIASLPPDSHTLFNRAGAPITFHLSCPTLAVGADTVMVYDNGVALPFAALAASADKITISAGLASGRHELRLVAQDIYGFPIEKSVIVWTGQFKVPVRVLDDKGAPAAGITVMASLADDPQVRASMVTDASGRGSFDNLPNSVIALEAIAPGRRPVTRSASVLIGAVTLRLNRPRFSAPPSKPN